MQSTRILQSNTDSSTDSLISSDRIVFRLANWTPYAFASHLPHKTLVFCPQQSTLPRQSDALRELTYNTADSTKRMERVLDSRVLSRQSKIIGGCVQAIGCTITANVAAPGRAVVLKLNRLVSHCSEKSFSSRY